MLGEGGTLELTDASVPWDWGRTTEHVYMFFGLRAGGGGTLELTDASVPWDWGRTTKHVYMFFGLLAGGVGTLELTDASVPWDWGRMTEHVCMLVRIRVRPPRVLEGGGEGGERGRGRDIVRERGVLVRGQGQTFARPRKLPMSCDTTLTKCRGKSQTGAAVLRSTRVQSGHDKYHIFFEQE